MLQWISDLLKRAELITNFSTGKGDEDFEKVLETWYATLKTEQPSDEELRYCEQRIFKKPVTIPNLIKLIYEYRESKGVQNKSNYVFAKNEYDARQSEKDINKEQELHEKMANMTPEEFESFLKSKLDAYEHDLRNENVHLVCITKDTFLPINYDERGNPSNFKMKLKDSLQNYEDTYRSRYGVHVNKYKGDECFNQLPDKYKIKLRASINTCFKRPEKEEKKSNFDKEMEFCQKKQDIEQMQKHNRSLIDEKAKKYNEDKRKYNELYDIV